MLTPTSAAADSANLLEEPYPREYAHAGSIQFDGAFDRLGDCQPGWLVNTET